MSSSIEKETDVRKLGLVGGMGPESTIMYYHDIVYGVKDRLGSDAFAPLVIESVDVSEVIDRCKSKEYRALADYLVQAIGNLAAAGADFAALSANTPHVVFDEVQKHSPLPLVSIVEATCREAQRRDLTTIGLLGTIFTMAGEFFMRPFAEAGIDVVVPTEDEMAFVNDRIANELELGIIKDETRQAFIEIITRMKEESDIQAIVLGCTELPLILNDGNTPVPCLDTVVIHVNELIDRIIDR